MADVFISYARAERADAERIKRRLEDLGLSVFLDVEGLEGGDVFSERLDREVKMAGAVLGLWSPLSLSRPWVQTECDIGRRRGVLVPAAIRFFTDMEVPAAFWNVQFVDLIEALDDPGHPSWRKLAKSLERTLKQPAGTLSGKFPPESADTNAPPTPAIPGAAASSRRVAHTTRAKPRAAPLRARRGGLLVSIVAAIGLIIVVGAGVWFFDPFHWRATPTSPAVSTPAAADSASSATPTSPAVSTPAAADS